METIKLTTDNGSKQTDELWKGNFLTEDAFDNIVSPTVDTAIYKPGGTLFDDVPLAYIICDAYPNNNVFNCLKTIEESTTMRANCSGPILEEDMKAKGIEEYKLRTPNSYHVRTKSGDWGMIAYANEIHSVMAGWKRGRFTGGIEMSGWTKDNPDKYEILRDVSTYNEKAFKKADSNRYLAQKQFAKHHIKTEHRQGIVTTMSMNRYSDLGLGSGGMAAHIDSGDNDQGMTTMCHFRDGEYTGAYLTWPRYGIAINAPNNSVIIADSLELHGVTPIRGEGTRYTCVTYCDRRLATMGSIGKTPRKIGKYRQDASLENFLA
tara:strand:+ start:436 stop:1395 length:960 start_codon:yes stop_codon:yes gene_type:complete